MAMEIDRYKSRKSRTTYIVSEEAGKAYISAEGEMSTNQKVLKQIDDVRRGSYDKPTTLWIARQLSNTY